MLRYLETSDKATCFGCSACVAACGIGAITMKPDSEGFCYPQIDAERCVSCGACERACPYEAEGVFQSALQHAFALQARDTDVLLASASGAAFALMGRNVIDRGGWVCGCVFEDGWKAQHIITRDDSEFKKMFGSKYVQSDMGDCYRRIRNLLKNGDEVLFSGTPCQVAGLYTYLGKTFEGLCTIDLICHGVPSQGLLDDYLAAEGTAAPIESFSFRDKSRNGWCSNGTIVKTKNGLSSVRRTSPLGDTYYYYYYLANAVSRECCYQCPFSCERRVADLTIGDYWNADSAGLGFDYRLGTSAVIANTPKGEELVAGLGVKAHIESANLLHVIAGNGNLSKPCERPLLRDEVYRAIASEGYAVAAKRLCRLKPWVPVIKRIVPSGLKKMLKGMRHGK